jgi:acetyltransferase-like isoleucine patch superfamily enzyme
MSSSMHRSDNDASDPLGLISRGLTKFHSLWVSLTYPFASRGRNLSIHYAADLKRPMARRIKLGSDVQIGKDAWLNIPLGDTDAPAIIIEDNCVVGRRSQISARNCIHLERDVILSASVILMDHNHAYEDVTLPIRDQGVTAGGRIRIEQGCWIGHGAAIVCDKGELVLGRNSVVATNAVVTRSCPPYSVVSGNPARVIKQFDPVRQAWVLGSSRSVEPAADRQKGSQNEHQLAAGFDRKDSLPTT